MVTAEGFTRELERLSTEQIHALIVLTRPTLSGREMDAIRQVLASRLAGTNANAELQAAYSMLEEDKPTETATSVTVLVGSTQFGCWIGEAAHHGSSTLPTVESPSGEPWTEQKNLRRRELIDKKIQRKISPHEQVELDQL